MANLIGPEGVLLASSLFEARLAKEAKPDDKPKFYARVGYDETAKNSPEMKAISAAVVQAVHEKWGREKGDAMLKEGSITLPFRKDIAAKNYPEHLAFYIGGSTLQQPGVVSRYAGADGKPKPITDKAEIYPGCKVRASYSVRAYGGPGTSYSAGVSLDLRNVQKLGDGERLSQPGDAAADFGNGESEPDAAPIEGGSMAGLLD